MTNWMRRNRRKVQRGSKGSGAKGNKRCFGFREEIQLTRKPKNLLFLRGDYTSFRGEENLPFWTWIRHKFIDAGNQVTRTGRDGSEYQRDFMASFFCTRAGTPDWSGECTACDRNNPRMDPEDKDKRLGASSIAHWSVIDLSWYYRTVNKWGDTVYKQPASAAEEKKFQDEGYEKVFGKKGYLNFGPLHKEQFDDNVLKTIERMCGGCEWELGHEHRYEGSLEPAIFKCESCGGTVEDLAISEWNGNQIDQVAYGDVDVKCPSCGFIGQAEVEYGCTECTSPTPVDLFDCIIPLSKFVSTTENGKTNSAIQVPTGKQIIFATDFKLPDGEDLVRITDSGETEFNPSFVERGLTTPIDFKGDLFAKQDDSEYQHHVTNGALDPQGFTPRKK
jgi:hypothetical protein